MVAMKARYKINYVYLLKSRGFIEWHVAPPPGSKLPIAPIHGPTNPNAQRGSAACTVRL